MKFAALLLVLGWLLGMCLAQQTPKPVCNAKTRGQFWPEEANHDQDVMRHFIQSGELEMCARNGSKYRWERFTVDVHDLAKGKRPVSSDQGTPAAKGTK